MMIEVLNPVLALLSQSSGVFFNRLHDIAQWSSREPNPANHTFAITQPQQSSHWQYPEM